MGHVDHGSNFSPNRVNLTSHLGAKGTVRGRKRRLATGGIVAVLLIVPALALWTAAVNYGASQRASHAILVSNAFEEARFALATEESLERKYRLEPGPEVRAKHAAAAAAMTAAFTRAERLGSPFAPEGVLYGHLKYLDATSRMFDAMDANDIPLALAIDSDELDPVFDSIEHRIQAAAASTHQDALEQLATLLSIQTRTAWATPIVLALAGLAVISFWSVLNGYRAHARESRSREAAALEAREQRFRLLVQNADEMILICSADGRISYQSPAAEFGWKYGPTELLDHDIADFVHHDARAALSDLLDQMQRGTFAGGLTRTTELQFRRRSGEWRWIELVMTNLLHEPAIDGVVVTIRDIQDRKTFEQQLMQQAFYDTLTGLPNRLLLQDRLHQALVRNERRGGQVGLLFLDLDNFKLINDSLGHQIGDALLVQAAERLQSCIRSEDTVARLGGDEFVVVLGHLLTDGDAAVVADTIVTLFARPFRLDDRDVTVTVSIGIALGGMQPDQSETLLRNADVAMYRAKSDGRGRAVVFDASMHTDSLARLETENELRRAIEDGQLRVYYQPIVKMDAEHGAELQEVEALVRWEHPVRGLIQPAGFIAIAEETGLIVPLGLWVLEQACHQAAAWHAAFPDAPRITLSVNLSPRQFQSNSLVADVKRVLTESGLPASYLKLEITEGVIMRDVEATIRTLEELKDLGIKLAVDDFGTGYSSLAYLKRLPLDVLKIDRSFVSGLGQKAEDSNIVRAIISLAKSLNLATTGEGIETHQQAELLSTWGCDRGQGYLYGRPHEEAIITDILRTAEHSRRHGHAPAVAEA